MFWNIAIGFYCPPPGWPIFYIIWLIMSFNWPGWPMLYIIELIWSMFGI